MQHRLVANESRDGRPHPAVLAAVAVAWTCLGFASLSGLGAWLGHGHLLEGGLPIPLLLGSFVGGWLVMLLAMMLPTLPRQSRPAAGFVAGFLWIWMAFGLAALLFDTGIHWSVDHSPWLHLHVWLVQAGLLAAAGGYQLTSAKQHFLRRCVAPAPARSITEGWLAGALSVGCCWALMLTAFAAGMTQLGWMVGLTLAMVAEREPRRSNHASALVGVVLLALAAGLVVASSWGSPRLFAT
jgi:predicted metal-binding membrane protein